MKVILSGSITPPEFVVSIIDEENNNAVLHSDVMEVTKDTSKAALDVFEEKVVNEYKSKEAEIEAKVNAKKAVEDNATALFAQIGLDDQAQVTKPYPVKTEPAPVEEGTEAAAVTP